jgi:hypothetical protein
LFAIATYLQDSCGWQLPTRKVISIAQGRAAVDRSDDIDLESIGNMTTPIRPSRVAMNS